MGLPVIDAKLNPDGIKEAHSPEGLVLQRANALLQQATSLECGVARRNETIEQVEKLLETLKTK